MGGIEMRGELFVYIGYLDTTERAANTCKTPANASESVQSGSKTLPPQVSAVPK